MKPRVIICLTLRDGVLIRTKKFEPDYIYTQKFIGTLEADEVVMVDVGTNRQAFYRAAEKYAKRCFSPLTLGGHVRSVDEAERLLELGADKVLIAGWNGGLIVHCSNRWGNQAIVAGNDICESEPITDVVEWAERMTDRGAGEILLTSVERDGSLQGYDLDTLKAVCAAVDVPVVVSGGCGSWVHMRDAFKAGAAGAATTCIHHFTDGALKAFKDNLRHDGVEVRN